MVKVTVAIVFTGIIIAMAPILVRKAPQVHIVTTDKEVWVVIDHTPPLNISELPTQDTSAVITTIVTNTRVWVK